MESLIDKLGLQIRKQHSFSCIAVCYAVLWGVLVASFTAYGWFGAAPEYQLHGSFSLESALQVTVKFGAVGIAVASHIVAGLLILRQVRLRRLESGIAVVILLACSFICTLLPALIIWVPAHFTQYAYTVNGELISSGIHLFQGELNEWAFLTAPLLAFCFVVLTFIIFIVCLFRTRKC